MLDGDVGGSIRPATVAGTRHPRIGFGAGRVNQVAINQNRVGPAGYHSRAAAVGKGTTAHRDVRVLTIASGAPIFGRPPMGDSGGKPRVVAISHLAVLNQDIVVIRGEGGASARRDNEALGYLTVGGVVGSDFGKNIMDVEVLKIEVIARRSRTSGNSRGPQNNDPEAVVGQL